MKRNSLDSFGAALVGALICSPARAATSVGAATIELAPVPPGSNCLSERQLAMKIQAELLGMGQDARSAQAAVRVRILRGGGQFTAQIEVEGQPKGQRQLEAAECESLAEALAVAIAVVLDGQAARAADERSGTIAATSQPNQNETSNYAKPVESATRSDQAKPSALQPRDTPVRGTMSGPAMIDLIPATTAEPTPKLRRGGLGLWLGGGVASDASLLISAGVALDWLPFEARLGAWWQSTPDLNLTQGTVARSRLGGALAGCMVWGRRWRLLGCGHTWLGAESFEGQGFAQPRFDTVFWGAAGPGIGISTGQRLRIALDAIGLVNFTNDRYVARVAGAEQKTDALALWLMLRIGLSSAFGPSLVQPH